VNIAYRLGNRRGKQANRVPTIAKKWFLLQNIKDSSYFRNDVFSNEE
jgi:hypothetical protein